MCTPVAWRPSRGAGSAGAEPYPVTARPLDEPTEDGLIVLADEGPHGPLRRASLTDAGQARYAALREQHGERNARTEPEVPAFDVRVCRLSFTEPRPLAPPPPRWARDQYDRRLHALEGVDVLLAEARGYAECLCGQQLPAEVVFEDGPSGALCLPCVVGAVADVPDPGNWGSPL